jgi:hypothetical protein
MKVSVSVAKRIEAERGVKVSKSLAMYKTIGGRWRRIPAHFLVEPAGCGKVSHPTGLNAHYEAKYAKLPASMRPVFEKVAELRSYTTARREQEEVAMFGQTFEATVATCSKRALRHYLEKERRLSLYSITSLDPVDPVV